MSKAANFDASLCCERNPGFGGLLSRFRASLAGTDRGNSDVGDRHRGFIVLAADHDRTNLFQHIHAALAGRRIRIEIDFYG